MDDFYYENPIQKKEKKMGVKTNGGNEGQKRKKKKKKKGKKKFSLP